MSLKSVGPSPVMKKKPHTTKIHGYDIEDPYFWFREKELPEVIDHLNAENEYLNKVLKAYEPLKSKLFDELKARVKQEDQSVPWRNGEYVYYSKTLEGQEHAIHCRRKVSLENFDSANEEVILDVNELAKGKDYIQVPVVEPSPDNKILAYTTDFDGSEKFQLRFRDLATLTDLPTTIEDVYYSVEWANDSQTLYFVRLNDKQRPTLIFRYTLGHSADSTEIVYEEHDPEFFAGVTKSRSQDYLVVHTGGTITDEFYFIDANDPKALPQLFCPRRKGIEMSVAHGGGEQFYVSTNEEAQNFKVYKVNWNRRERENWQEFIPHNSQFLIEGVHCFKNQIALWGMENGLANIDIYDHQGKKLRRLEMPEANYEISSEHNPDFASEKLRFSYSSPVTPPSVLEADMNSGEIISLKEKEVPTYNKNNYVTERVFATASDGTKVPMSLLYKKGLQKDGSNPCYLYAYGSYGMSMPPFFRQTAISLVDRGFVFAVAHIRGGSEMGRQWYEDGKLLKKKNTFTDFISCAEHLIQQKFTQKQEIVICGGSAGGLLMGATVNLRPDLFKAAVAHVPFVDVINTMLDDSLPLTTIEYEQWGNPNNKEYFDYIMSYSPYDNVEAKDYPHILITAGLNDPRVTYWEPAKWCAKLRELKTDNNQVLLYTNMDAGHGGQSGRFERLKEYALEYAFILAVFGIEK